MRDLSHNIGAVLALAPAVQAATVAGLGIDTKGFESLAFLVNTGAIVGAGDFSVKLQECDTLGGTYTDVAASQFDSNAPATLLADNTYKLGYRGSKGFAKIALTKAGGTSIIAGAVAVKGNANFKPVN